MVLGPRGSLLIRTYEAFRSQPYLDQEGTPTIGFGTIRIDGKPVTMQTPACTIEQAMAWFVADSVERGRVIQSVVRVVLTQNQFDALVSFAYNVGEGAFKSSSLLRAINARTPITEDLFTRWNKVHIKVNGVLTLVESAGLTRRRKDEFQLFMSPA